MKIRQVCHPEFAIAAIGIIQCSINKAAFFDLRLHASLTFNVKQAIRLIVTRSEVDLNDIKMAYERLYRKSLRDSIKVSSMEFFAVDTI